MSQPVDDSQKNSPIVLSELSSTQLQELDDSIGVCLAELCQKHEYQEIKDDELDNVISRCVSPYNPRIVRERIVSVYNNFAAQKTWILEVISKMSEKAPELDIPSCVVEMASLSKEQVSECCTMLNSLLACNIFVHEKTWTAVKALRFFQFIEAKSTGAQFRIEEEQFVISRWDYQ
jgi:hypothetical protein